MHWAIWGAGKKTNAGKSDSSMCRHEDKNEREIEWTLLHTAPHVKRLFPRIHGNRTGFILDPPREQV